MMLMRIKLAENAKYVKAAKNGVNEMLHTIAVIGELMVHTN